MVGDDCEFIGCKGRFLCLIKQKVICCWVWEEDYDDEYDDDDYEDEKLVLRKVKGKGGKFCWKCSWLWLLVKLGIVFVVLIVVYGVYFDQKICSCIDGKVWELLVVVYGWMVNFELDMQISKNEMVCLFNVMQYCQVSVMMCFGEYIVQVNSIEMICCLFDFLDSKEGQVCVCFIFDGDYFEIIENMDNNCQFGFFCFDLCFIIMLQLLNGEQCLFVKCSGFFDLLVDILLVIEDCYFYEYDGISFYFIGCVVLVNLMVG